MKTTLILCMFVMVFSTSAIAQVPNEVNPEPGVTERIYTDSTGTYVIKFTYGMFEPYTPVDGEEGDLRYSAFIQVYEIEGCQQFLIGKGFMGAYDPNGCIYDEAEYLISEARKIEFRASR